MRLSRVVLLLVAGAGVLQLLYYYPRVPDEVASHFDGRGNPDGYQSRDGFFGMSAAMLVLAVGLFGGLGAIFRRIPSKWFNLPHRDYWLAPERREETLDFITGQLEWYGAATLLLFLFVVQMAVEANFGPERRLDAGSIWLVLGLYLLFNGIWLTRFI
ncbi:MAG: DUF1648 domain-containing protein, partial [Vicinamibacteria bacterium]